MFTGYDPLRYKLAIWTLSAVMCGIAGALYVPQVGIINPSEMTPAASIEIAIWAAVGGRGDADRADRRRLLRQRREELVHAGLPRVLAVLPRRAVHRRDAVPAAGHHRPVAQPRCSRAAKRAGATRHDARPDAAPAPSARRARRGARRGARHGSSGGRAASYGARRQPGELDIAHGAILYLDDITVSFDGFKALNALSLSDQRRRAALHHRPERRRQDDDDGRHHRQDAARRRQGASSARRSTCCACARTRSRRSASAASSRSRRCSSTSSVFENLELALKADRGVRASLFFRLTGEQLDRIGEMLSLIHLKEQRAAHRRAALARPEAVARDRHAADAGPEAAAARRAGRRHDRRGDRAHRRAVPLARGQPFAGGGRARHEVHRRADARQPGQEGDGAARRQRAGRRARSPTCRRTRRWSRSTLAADASTMLHRSTGINQYYGGSHILRNVALRGAASARSRSCSAATASARRRC